MRRLVPLLVTISGLVASCSAAVVEVGPAPGRAAPLLAVTVVGNCGLRYVCSVVVLWEDGAVTQHLRWGAATTDLANLASEAAEPFHHIDPALLVEVM